MPNGRRLLFRSVALGLLLGLAPISQSTDGQVRFGTLINIYREPKTIFIVADRRVISVDKATQRVTYKDAVKIVPVGQFVAFTVVNFEHGGTFSVSATTRKWLLHNKLGSDLRASLLPLAEQLEVGARKYVNTPGAAMPPGGKFFSEVILVRWNEPAEQPELAIIDLLNKRVGPKYETSQNTAYQDLIPGNSYAAGDFLDQTDVSGDHADYVAMKLDLKRENAQSKGLNPLPQSWIVQEARTYYRDIYRIKSGAHNGASPVGPTIDVAKVSRHGVEWIYRDRPIPSSTI